MKNPIDRKDFKEPTLALRFETNDDAEARWVKALGLIFDLESTTNYKNKVLVKGGDSSE